MLVENVESYKDLMEKLLGGTGVIACDTETEEFTKEKTLPQDLAIDGVGVYTPEVQAYIQAEFLDHRFQELLDTRRTIWHNAKFDLKVLECAGFNVDKMEYDDTLVMSWLVDENCSHQLKDLAQSLLGVVEVIKFKDLPKKPEEPDYVDCQATEIRHMKEEWDAEVSEWQKVLADYCIKDCEYTYKLYQIFLKDLFAQDLYELYHDLELPFIEVLRRMETRGILVDVEYLNSIDAPVKKRIDDAIAEAHKIVGREFNPGSAVQLRKILYEEMGCVVPDDFRTPKGEMSTNVMALNYLKDTNELAATVLKHREFSKLYSTYIVGLRDKTRSGVLHASFNQTGTVTGRLSSSRPNLQNIPRRDDEFDIRRAFVPREGYTFIIADYSQIELRLMAHYSRAKAMVENYKVNGDIHQMTADAIGCDRNVAKTINFGLNYGRTAYGMAKGMDIDEDEAEKFIDGYFEKFPEVLEFMRTSVIEMRQTGSVRTIMKRKRRFPSYMRAVQDGDEQQKRRIERQTGNAIIQGGASDVMKIAMLEIDREIRQHDAHTLLQIHDEVVVECPTDKVDMVMAIVKDKMENAVDLGDVPLVTEPKTADHWMK